MKRVLIVILGIASTLFLNSCGYNSMVEGEEGVAAAWAQVENQYQRRADLIPNLVETVKAYADFEKQTLVDVMEARASATQVKVDPSKLTPESIQQFEQAQTGLSSALGRLMVVVEKYPDLKANQNFLELQAQLEGTENRIAVERQKFNQAVQGYNTMIRRFPSNLTAGMFGFEKKGYFQAEAGANKAPKVGDVFKDK